MVKASAFVPERSIGRHLHRAAWGLACAMFLAMCVGGLVSTYAAGTAIPDRPHLLSYFVFLYPLPNWLGVWDVFLEHSHRLIGTAAGMMAVAVAALLAKCEPRRWVCFLGMAAVLGVGVQGALGGLRVIYDAPLLAKLHASAAPLLVALAAAMVTVTSRPWCSAATMSGGVGRGALWLALGGVAGVYVQILVGVMLRHISSCATPGWFALWTWLHLGLAGGVVVGTTWLAMAVRPRADGPPWLGRRALVLVGLLGIQVLLGLATWVVHFTFPAWFSDYVWDAGYLVVAEAPLQVIVTTAHVVTGSLCLATAVSLTLWLRRCTAVRCTAPSETLHAAGPVVIPPRVVQNELG